MQNLKSSVENLNILSLEKSHAKSTMRAIAGLAVSVGLLTLAGCAQVSSVQSGTSIEAVVSKYGRPDVTCSQTDGSSRMIWTSQPQGETAFALVVGADKRVSSSEQVLDEQHFAILNNGEAWTAEKIRCQFGPPARITTIDSGKSKQYVWYYRYMQVANFAVMMTIYMGEDGKAMTSNYSVPDPERNQVLMGG